MIWLINQQIALWQKSGAVVILKHDILWVLYIIKLNSFNTSDTLTALCQLSVNMLNVGHVVDCCQPSVRAAFC